MKRSRSGREDLPPDYLEPLVRALEQPDVLAGIRVEELGTVAFQLALYFGVRRDPATAAVLGGVYERLTEHVTAAERAEFVEELTAAVRRGATSVLALLPVLQRERDAGVARAAALAFALLAPPDPGDPFAGPRSVRTLFEHTEPDALRAGLVGALLALGDARVRPMLEGLARALSPGARDALLALSHPMVTRLELEWRLDWLEDADAATFEAVAASLASLATEGGGHVLDVQREFPAAREGESLTVLSEWSVAETGERLAARFHDLARRAEPGAMDAVLRAWGVPG